MACPYFIPTTPHPGELWRHRHSLPLGDGFTGRCGLSSSEADCDEETLRLQCNLGYANCAHLPAQRELDAVRFYVQSDGSATLRVQFCGERAHHPVKIGELRFDTSSAAWMDPPDLRISALADAAVRAWINGHTRSANSSGT